MVRKKETALEYTQDSVVSLISHIHTITADFTNRKLSEKGKFVSSHGFILYLLSIEKQLSKKEIAQKINRDKSTATVLIRRLIDEGLVEETSSPDDNRIKLISLTDKGKKLNDTTSGISKSLLEVCYRGFSDEEKSTLLSLLLKMNANVEKSLKEK
ncbi:MAG: MarR family transcriptional regulator [Treponema sp.]|nr:MarR family transcriptional regulator [Treponema sp.]